ncbi:MAG: IS630 family transposase, partial [Syntrophobacteraceae bacterium]
MPKSAPRIEVTEQERTELETMARKPSTAQGMAMRANIILMAAEGKQNKEIQETLRVNKNVVGLW